MFKPIFHLFPAAYQNYESLQSFQKLPESINPSTLERLSKLKNQIKEFDQNTENVKDLNLKFRGSLF